MASCSDPVGIRGDGRRKACRFEGKVESRKTERAEPACAAWMSAWADMAGACERVWEVEVSEEVVLPEVSAAMVFFFWRLGGQNECAAG